ncbi:hypothetical protein, partial [Allosphingosinicella sp.]|uniref:hypothetical protein n=1 Tax=Allosphingosinicella sp. TaxID=2823234 RepID=UPI003D731048
MFRVRLDSSDLKRALQLARNDLRTEVPQLMELCGVQLLSDAQLAYDQKSRGLRGEDGIQWPKLKRATLAARVRRVGRGRAIVKKRKDPAGQIRRLKIADRRQAKAARRSKGGRDFKTKAKASSGMASQIDRLRKQRAELLKELERLIDAAVAQHSIGVDTGLQRASARPSFLGSDGKGGNVLQVTGNQVTVGYGR